MSEHSALGKYSQEKIEQMFILKSLLKLTFIELLRKKKDVLRVKKHFIFLQSPC